MNLVAISVMLIVLLSKCPLIVKEKSRNGIFQFMKAILPKMEDSSKKMSDLCLEFLRGERLPHTMLAAAPVGSSLNLLKVPSKQAPVILLTPPAGAPLLEIHGHIVTRFESQSPCGRVSLRFIWL